MLFHSQVFILLFLPAVLAAYYASARSVRGREWILVAASLVFYGWWDVRFIPLLVTQVVATWVCAAVFFQIGRRSILSIGIVANLACLAFFKYADFAVEALEAALGFALPRADILLPIGISFYTFQLVSYLIDVKRGEAPSYPLRRLALFPMFFPHLVSGPIVRHNELIPQFDFDPLRTGVDERLSRGLALFIVAIAIKVFIADRLGAVADPVFAEAANSVPAWSAALTGLLAFALQIFFDFASYTDMAIALALMFGITFPINFQQPYRSTDIAQLWRRWHMTLSRFLRDYVYIPLGGSRHGLVRTSAATMVTMVLCGLWHGAGWTFVLWGALHGLALVILRIWKLAGVSLPKFAAWALTFSFTVLAFGVFRSSDLTTAWSIWSGLAGGGGFGEVPKLSALSLIAVGLGLALMPASPKNLLERWLTPRTVTAAALALLAVFIVLKVGPGQPATFIYFQF